MRGWHHRTWRRQVVGIRYTHTLLMYLLHIFWTLRSQPLCSNNGMNMTIHGIYFILNVTITVSIPRGSMIILLITLMVWDMRRINTKAQYIFLLGISLNIVNMKTNGLWYLQTGIIFTQRISTPFINLRVFRVKEYLIIIGNYTSQGSRRALLSMVYPIDSF